MAMLSLRLSSLMCCLALAATVFAADRTSLIPITELGKGFYKGQTGGLYGDGNNIGPQAHLDAAKPLTNGPIRARHRQATRPGRSWISGSRMPESRRIKYRLSG